jgi:hypothetical protein
MAMEMILWHWDGYTMARNNWRIFHDKDAGRMVFIPQGVDQMFNNQNGPLVPDQPNGLVARAVLQVPELRERYYDKLAYITTNVFVPEAVHNRILEVSDKIASVLTEMESPAAADRHRGYANSLRNKVKRRANHLEAQLFPAPSVEFDPSGIVALKEWEPQIYIPDADLAKDKDPDGTYFLRISSEKPCSATWRTSRLLPQGKYRFEARIKTKGVVLRPDQPRDSAGLRISGYRGETQRNEGDNDWKEISFEFDVNEPQREVELVCELRAEQGTIWYDVNSLRLRKL